MMILSCLKSDDVAVVQRSETRMLDDVLSCIICRPML
jgi:hypothetical protein